MQAGIWELNWSDRVTAKSQQPSWVAIVFYGISDLRITVAKIKGYSEQFFSIR